MKLSTAEWLKLSTAAVLTKLSTVAWIKLSAEVCTKDYHVFIGFCTVDMMMVNSAMCKLEVESSTT